MLARHDHRPADAVFLRQPEATLPLGVGAKSAMARIDGDVRPPLRRQLLALVAGSGHGRRHKAETERERRHHNCDFHHRIPPASRIDGRPLRRFRQPLGEYANLP